MRGTLLVAARELSERRTILIAALVAGCLPFASPFLPGVRSDQVAEARDAMALTLAAAFGLGAALLLGAAAVGRDLAEGRLGFDFSRPLPGVAIWSGRLLGALAVTLVVLTLVVLPASLAGGGIFSAPLAHLIRPGSLAVLGALLFLLPLAHVVSIAFRSRSAWLGADMIAASLLVVVLGIAARRLYAVFAFNDLVWGLLVVGIVSIPVLWAASAIQVAGGRTDLRRGHRLQSLALWSALFALALCFEGYTRWVVTAAPDDLTGALASPAGRGTWAFVSGSARGRGDFEAAFLVDTASNRFVRIGSLRGLVGWQSLAFSGDGRRVAWLRISGPQDARTDTFFADLDLVQPAPREARISFSDPWVEMAISEDGKRMAALSDGLLSVYELDSGKVLGSAKMAPPEKGRRPSLLFAGEDVVRVVVFQPLFEIHEYRISTRRLERTGQASSVYDVPWVSWDRQHDRLLVREFGGGRRIELLDARSAATLASLPASEPSTKRQGHRFLADGRIAFVESGGGAARLRVLRASGDEGSSIDLGRVGEELWLGGEAAPGKLVLAHGPRAVDAERASTAVLLVDIQTGQVREVARGLFPILAFYPWGGAAQAPEPGGAAAGLFQAGAAVVYMDPVQGVRRVVAGREAPGSAR